MKNFIFIILIALITLSSNAANSIEFSDISIQLTCYPSGYSSSGESGIDITGYENYYIMVKPVYDIGGDMIINNLTTQYSYGLLPMGVVDGIHYFFITADNAKFNIYFDIPQSSIKPNYKNTLGFWFRIGTYTYNSDDFQGEETIYSEIQVKDNTNVSVDEEVCNSSGYNAAISNLPSDVSYVSWTASSNLTFPNGNTGTDVDIQALNSGIKEAGWVKPTLHFTSCSGIALPQVNTWVGTKIPTISHAFDPSCNCQVAAVETGIMYDFYALIGGEYIHAPDADYSWYVTPPVGSRDFPYYGTGENFSFSAMEEGEYKFQVKYNGECGWSDYATKYFDFEEGFLMMMSPVPATTELNVEVVTTSTSSPEEEVTVELYDKYSKLKKHKKAKKNKFTINVSELPPDVYIIKVKKRDKVKTKQIVVE